MFVCEEEDVHTLAGLNLQVDFGDFEPLKTPARLQKKLGDYIPNHAKSLQVSACRQRRDIDPFHQNVTALTHAGAETARVAD